MAKIVLIDVAGWQGGVDKGDSYPNIGIAYLVAALKNAGYSVTVLDLNNEFLSDTQLYEALSPSEVMLVGLSVKTATMENACRLGRGIKSIYPNLPIIVGGPHATLAAPSVAEEPWVDYVLLGEGEFVLPELCLKLEEHRPIDGLDGVIVCDKSTALTRATVVRVARLEELAYPDFTDFGTGIQEVLRRNYPLITSRGCPYKCTYCSVPKISGNRVRTRSPDHVVDELSLAQDLYGVTGFEVVDDSFNVDMARAKEFCRLLIERQMGMTWTCPNGIRADRIDVELASLMVQSGCHSVMVGVESADPLVLATVQKGETLETIEKGIKILKAAGLSVGGYFIIGLPNDSYESQVRSVEFALRNGIDAHFNMLVPYPSTEVYDWVSANGRFLNTRGVGLHFADSKSKVHSVFETNDFPAHERQRAYEMTHTRLLRFDMIIPHNVSKWRYRLMVIRLMLRYDRRSLPALILKAVARVSNLGHGLRAKGGAS